MISPSMFARLGFTFAFGVILMLLPFIKSGPDSRLSRWRDGRVGWATNDDGSLKKHTKFVLTAIFIFLLILVWIVPDRFIGLRTLDGGFHTGQ